MVLVLVFLSEDSLQVLPNLTVWLRALPAQGLGDEIPNGALGQRPNIFLYPFFAIISMPRWSMLPAYATPSPSPFPFTGVRLMELPARRTM